MVERLRVRRWLFGLVAGVLLGVTALLTIGRIPPTRTFHDRSCVTNMKNIVGALHQYHDDYGCFPPAVVTDQSGRPMHSWRVLLLPYLDQDGLYRQYDFSEPWNGPHNRLLHAVRFDMMGCSSDPFAARHGWTSYVAVVGPESAWPGASSLRLADVTDGPANTVMLVEVWNSGIHWMEPRDLDFSSLDFRLNGPEGIGSNHARPAYWLWESERRYVHVGRVDGRIRVLPVETDPDMVRAILTVDGGERVDVPWQPGW